MASKCGTCINLNLKEKSKWSDKYWCMERHNYFGVNDYSCSYYNEDPNRVRDSQCYITTIVCHTLGYDDNCELLNILRDFRENYLKKHQEYLELLLEYDTVGPIISQNIALENNYAFCLIMLNGYLIPCANYIKNGNFENAITIYKNMVKHLTQKFNIPLVEIKVPTNLDLENLGKGRLLIKNA